MMGLMLNVVVFVVRHGCFVVCNSGNEREEKGKRKGMFGCAVLMKVGQEKPVRGA